MATRAARNGEENPTLAGALASLLQNQARFVSHLDEDRKRFARIEHEMLEIKTLLLHHDEILKVEFAALKAQFAALKAQFADMKENLPEAIRKKIGFQQG